MLVPWWLELKKGRVYVYFIFSTFFFTFVILLYFPLLANCTSCKKIYILIIPFIRSFRFLINQYSRFTLKTFQKQVISDNSTAKIFEIIATEFRIIVDLLCKLFTWHLLINSKLFRIFLLRMYIKFLKLSQSNSV